MDSSEAKRSGEDTPEDPRHHHDIDWVAAERSPEFQELIAKKRSFVLPALGFVFIWYFGFILLAGYAPDFMGESVYEGLTLGYLLALTQFVMVAVLGLWYLRYSERELDPLRAQITRSVDHPGDGGTGPPTAREPKAIR